MGRVTFRTGRAGNSALSWKEAAANGTLLTAKYEGVCRECKRKFLPGDKIRARKGRGAVHADCQDWKYRERRNTRTEDGGWEMPPGSRSPAAS